MLEFQEDEKGLFTFYREQAEQEEQLQALKEKSSRNQKKKFKSHHKKKGIFTKLRVSDKKLNFHNQMTTGAEMEKDSSMRVKLKQFSDINILAKKKIQNSMNYGKLNTELSKISDNQNIAVVNIWKGNQNNDFFLKRDKNALHSKSIHLINRDVLQMKNFDPCSVFNDSIPEKQNKKEMSGIGSGCKKKNEKEKYRKYLFPQINDAVQKLPQQLVNFRKQTFFEKVAKNKTDERTPRATSNYTQNINNLRIIYQK